jgi:energy-coupling factor transport system substrate-specific component
MHTAARERHRRVRDLCVFAMLATVMFLSKLLMEWAPNIHFVGMLTVTYTLVYRRRALIPLYVYVLLMGVYAGFNVWWVPYVYIWTILWGITMLLPRNMPRRVAIPVYAMVCGLHGFAYGALYAPAQALFFGYTPAQTLAWIAAGLPFDALHAVGNLAAGVLIVPLRDLLIRLEKR